MIASAVGIKAWLARTPSVAELRPSRCLGCGAASCPVGGAIAVHGQGLSSRQVRGALELEDTPGVLVISIRKFECQRCGAVMTVVPSELLPHRQYTAPSIALALCLWLVEGHADSTVRARVCGWRIASSRGARGWAQLYRWARSASRLFDLPRPVAPTESMHETVRAVLGVLAALAPIAMHSSPAPVRVFTGASRASAMGIAPA